MARLPIVAIDGPAGAGKSTVAKGLAERLGFDLIDTGAIYRAVALLARHRGVALDDDPGLTEIVAALPIRFRFEGDVNRVFLGDEDVSEAIRTPEVSRAASAVSARRVVREGLLGLQRRLGEGGGVVLEGRDVGTVVFPDAEVKVFLTATDDERARRRHEELREKGIAATFEETLQEVRARDHQDSTRAHAPLRKADDATEVVTDGVGVEEVIERLAALVRAQANAGSPKDDKGKGV
jgi:cytidylate kinase